MFYDRIVRILIALCIILSGSFFYLCAEKNVDNSTVIALKGYLGKDELAAARKILDQLQESNTETLAIEVNSTSADLNQIFEIAKQIYALKDQRKLKVIVFIHDNALGPSAILPFLADTLYTSQFVSWGDIPSGAENTVPTNVLRNRVLSLIRDDQPHAALLKLLAAAMSDSSLKIVDDHGWKITSENAAGSQLISTPGQTLVVNQKQLQTLGLTSGVITADEFQQRYRQAPADVQEKETASSVKPQVDSLSSLDEQLKAHVKFNPEGPNTIGLITIEERTAGISESTWLYVKTALEYYKKHRPAFIILELNTPGGEVYAAQKISDALKNIDIQDNIPVMAFINNWAISAGAMLAYSTRFIAITKDAAMGAAEPVLATQTGETKEASEKVNSALRTDFANRARFFERNPYIAEGMVDKDIILVQRHGKIIKVDNESQVRTTGLDPDILIKAKGKLLTLNAEQLMQYGVANILLQPVKLDPLTTEEKESGKWPASKSLLFQQPYLAKIPNTTIDSYRMDWKTKFFVLLASPIVTSLLMLGLMMGFYLELSSPGFGLPATIALLCLFLIILSSLSLDIANWLEVIFVVTGLVVVIVDFFFLPTFGLLGFIGALMFLGGFFAMLLPGIGSVSFDVDTKTLNAAGAALLDRLAWISGTLVVGFLLMMLLGRYVTPKMAAWSRLVLTGSEQDASKGYVAGLDAHELPKQGDHGTVFATLRPAGKVIINHAIYDAISDGDFIEQGSDIIVSRLEGSVIVVKKENS